MNPSDETGSAVAVFGSSEPAPGDPSYEVARRLGLLLARAGFEVVTGGYGGVMEAASRGAREAGGRTLGVTCTIFSQRSPNRYLTRIVETGDLYERTRLLVERSGGYVVLPGKSGTLAELALLWAAHRAGTLDRKPVVLLGDEWRHLLRHLVKAGMLEAPQFDITRAVDSPEEAIDTIVGYLEGRKEK
jgi:uncharacterized protein (TIGR00730 family)